MLLFGKALAKARERVLLDLGLEGMPLERACAAAVRLLDLGYFRIGNDVYADENGSFGLTTLERRHVRKHQDTLVFAFVGKSGVEHEITIDDEVVIEAIDIMRRRRTGSDNRLLSYRNGRSWRSLLPDLVNDYVRESTGLESTAKDFRTWHATVLAAAALAEIARARGDQGVAEAGGQRRDEGGRLLPRQHAHPGPLLLRRPAGRRCVRAWQDHRACDAADLRHHRRAASRPRTGDPQAAPGVRVKVTAVQGDITEQEVDAVVNAANNRMRGGGGVDGAIHRAGGPAVLEDCRRRFPDGLATGEAGWTTAGDLPARWVIHVVGPNRTRGETDRSLLSSCYSRALEVADELGARTVAFPLVSAGVYGWPKDDAVAAALEVFRSADSQVEEARIMAFDRATYDLVSARLAE